MYRVLIVSVANFIDSTAEVPYLYKKAGCSVHVFCHKSSWLLSNKYFDRWIDAGDEENEPVFLNNFLELIKTQPNYYDKIVITDDATNKLLNDAIEDPVLFKKVLPLTKIENRNLLSSKAGFSAVLEKYQIATPKYITYHEGINLETIKKEFNFPILLKVDYSFSGIGLKMVEKPEDLSTSIEEIHDNLNLVLQEFIQGEDIGVEALFHEGKLIMYNCATINGYMYNRFSFTTGRTYYRDERIEKLLTELGEKIGLNGFASIQYVYCNDKDIFYLIEVDVRTNSWLPYGRFTGYNFSDGIRSIFDPTGNHKLLTKPKPKNTKVNVYIFDRDIRRCVKNRDYNGLLKWVTNHDGRWKYIPLYDWKLFRRIVSKIIYDFKQKII
ncbi:MAG: ATP-grasp domain-containing protein [Bacteroidota bacterium]